MRTSSSPVVWTLLALTLIGVGNVEAQATRKFQIHPSIGIARVGDSTSEHYLAPDSWQRDFVPSQGYRDAEGKIKRMGVRFRVYEFDASGNVLGQITSANAQITWRVHLVNKKAAKDGLNQEAPITMTINPGEQTIGPGGQRELRGDIGPSSNRISVKLGDLITTPNGHQLTVLGGHGVAGSWKASPKPPAGVDNPDWFDDTSDGPVQATIRFTVGDTVQQFEARPAWVLVAPPDYAHPVMNLVTLYDLVCDRSNPACAPTNVSFIRDVYPILRRVSHLQWTLMSQDAAHFGRTPMHAHGIEGTHPLLEGAHRMHRPMSNFLDRDVFSKLHLNDSSNTTLFAEAQGLRIHILDRLKVPGGAASEDVGVPNSMPAVEQLTLTPTQYGILSQWRDGLFTDDWNTAWNPVDPQPAYEQEVRKLSAASPTDVIDRASLDGGVGGPLIPGIDAGPLMAEVSTYDEPFHISLQAVQPGDITQALSVPWQAGFNQQTGLYPGARPVYVIVAKDGNYTTEFWTRPYTEQVPFTADANAAMETMNYDIIYANQRMVHNLSMVDHWKHLGFLARNPDRAHELMYIETDRAPGF